MNEFFNVVSASSTLLFENDILQDGCLYSRVQVLDKSDGESRAAAVVVFGMVPGVCVCAAKDLIAESTAGSANVGSKFIIR